MSQNSNHNQESDEARLQRMSEAVRTLLECIGEDPDREGLLKTPERVSKALLFFTHGYHSTIPSVVNDAIFHEDHTGMVVVRDIEIASMCEHHMVPFVGKAHIGYIPNGKVIGLSKLARIAEVFARRLQVQERMTNQIAHTVNEAVSPLGVAVLIECNHMCMVMRGVQKSSAMTSTTCFVGVFETSTSLRSEFLCQIKS